MVEGKTYSLPLALLLLCTSSLSFLSVACSESGYLSVLMPSFEGLVEELPNALMLCFGVVRRRVVLLREAARKEERDAIIVASSRECGFEIDGVVRGVIYCCRGFVSLEMSSNCLVTLVQGALIDIDDEVRRHPALAFLGKMI